MSRSDDTRRELPTPDDSESDSTLKAAASEFGPLDEEKTLRVVPNVNESEDPDSGIFEQIIYERKRKKEEASSRHRDLVGQLIAEGRYRVLSELDQGGMGVIYLAEDRNLHRKVVLKTVRRDVVDRSSSLERLLDREALLGARVTHPQICQVLDKFEDEEWGRFFVMQYVEGKSLREIMHFNPGIRHAIAADETRSADDGVLPQRLIRILDLVEVITLALHAAHQARVIHRDLKPANIMVRPDGVPVILDFGLARDQEANTEYGIGSRCGSPPYMSPEQVTGSREKLGEWTDVYAIGVILYELLTGRRPYTGSPSELAQAIREGEPVPPSRLAEDVPLDLEAVCLRAMHRSPAKRFANALHLADELRRVRAGKAIETECPGGWRLWLRRGWRDRRVEYLVAIIAVLVVLLALLGVWSAMLGEESSRLGEKVDLAQDKIAIEDIWELARFEKRDLTPSERNRAGLIAGGDQDLQLLVVDPHHELGQRRIRRRLRAGSRSQVAVSGLRLLQPHATVSSDRPPFAIAWDKSVAKLRPSVISIEDLDFGEVLVMALPESFHLDLEGEKGAIFEYSMPNALEPGRRYEWSLARLVEGRSMRLTNSPVLQFRVAEVGERQSVRHHRSNEDPIVDGILRAAALLESDFAIDADRVMSDLPASTSPAVRARQHLVSAAIALRLGRLSRAHQEFEALRALKDG